MSGPIRQPRAPTTREVLGATEVSPGPSSPGGGCREVVGYSVRAGHLILCWGACQSCWHPTLPSKLRTLG